MSCTEICPFDGPSAIIYTDLAPGFISLVNDRLLQLHRHVIEIGCIKNINPVADKAVQKLEN